MQPMKVDWNQVIHVYLPVAISVAAQMAFLVLPVNFRTWRKDLLNAWTYSGIQVFVASLLFIVIPKAFGIFELSFSATVSTLVMVFVASWWKVVRNIPLEATFPMTPEHVEQAAVSFDSFYNAERLRRLGELSGDDSYSLQRQKALREMLVRRRVGSAAPNSEDE